MLRAGLLYFLILFGCSCGNKNLLEEVIIFPSYPSASGIEQLQQHYYIIGDDARNILILDSSFRTTDSITLYPFSDQRIPKSVKADLESISITRDKKLLLLGSGSLAPYRHIGWLINTTTKEKQFIHLDTFYQRLQLNGIKELNIEGSCLVPGATLLANRGNINYPKNHLILTHHHFWRQQADAPVTIIPVGAYTDSSRFSGISGLTYAEKTDHLLLTVSTEDTPNAIDDGAIGKSYIWIIKNFTSKQKWKAINPDKIIDLEEIDARFKGQKIESVCIARETRRFLHLVLVADNDNGSSTLFRLVLEKD